MGICTKKWGNNNYLVASEDEKVLEKGLMDLYIAELKMPVTCKVIRERFAKEKPFKGIKIAACLHVTKETANLCRTLKAGGAEVYISGSNPLSTSDVVATALASEGIHVFAWHGNTAAEFYECIDKCLDASPNILIDDGADMIIRCHQKYHQLITNGTIIACQEETTTGVHRFRSMEAAGKLETALFPVNDARCKNEFDNELGTGQGIISAIYGMHILFAGKVVVIAGYGHCSSGMALRAKGLGARVIVTEVDPVEALRATFAGYEVAPMNEIIGKADIIFTATGCKDVVCKTHIPNLKDGVILGNLGHFDVEINAKDIYEAAKSKRPLRPDVEEITFASGKKCFFLGQGRLANLVLSEGHPSEVMDMSFGLQSLVAEHIVKNKGKFKPGMINVPEKINLEVATMKLKSMGIKIDVLTEDQKKYVNSYSEGT